MLSRRYASTRPESIAREDTAETESDSPLRGPTFESCQTTAAIASSVKSAVGRRRKPGRPVCAPNKEPIP